MSSTQTIEFTKGVGKIIAVLAVGAAILWFLAGILTSSVTPLGVQTIEEWAEEYYRFLFLSVFIPAALLALIWVSVTAIFDSGLKGDKRMLWQGLLLAAVIVPLVLYSPYFPEASAGKTLPGLIAMALCPLSFLVMTIWATPRSHRYAPWLSTTFRKRKLA